MIIPAQGFSSWLLHHGSLGLFVLLALGIVGLPIPDETLIVLAGLLCAQGHMQIYTAYPAALLGSTTGITVSYLLGYFAGQSLLKNYGPWIGLTEAKLEKVHYWFERSGKWLLLFGYFIPGVRHLSGFLVGAAYLEYPVFAAFAYTGALLWSALFFSIGYFFYHAWVSLGLGQFFS